MAQIITTQFSIGDTAYFPLFATATIYVVTVIDVYLRNVNGQSIVLYDLQRIDNKTVLQGIPQDQVFTFPQAKASLLTYLQAKITEVTNLTVS